MPTLTLNDGTTITGAPSELAEFLRATEVAPAPLPAPPSEDIPTAMVPRFWPPSAEDTAASPAPSEPTPPSAESVTRKAVWQATEALGLSGTEQTGAYRLVLRTLGMKTRKQAKATAKNRDAAAQVITHLGLDIEV